MLVSSVAIRVILFIWGFIKCDKNQSIHLYSKTYSLKITKKSLKAIKFY